MEEKSKEKKRRFNPLFFAFALLVLFWYVIIASLTSGCVRIDTKEAELILEFVLNDGTFETSDLENPFIEMQEASADLAVCLAASDPYWSAQNLFNVFDVYGYTGESPRIAVLDGGFQKHIDLDLSKVVDTWSFVYNSDDIWRSGSFEHGLNVMSQIGSINGNGMFLAGISIEWCLYEIAWTNSAFVEEIKLAEAIERAVENECDFIVCSWGGYGFSGILASSIKEAYENGVIVLASSGNEGKIIYPAAWDTVISVGASDIPKATPGGCYLRGKTRVLSREGSRDAEGTSFSCPSVALLLMGHETSDIWNWYRLSGYDPTKLDDRKIIIAITDEFENEVYRSEYKPGEKYRYREGWEIWVLVDRDRNGVMSINDILGNEKCGKPVRMKTVLTINP